MVMGIIILKKRYEPSKYVSVLMITLGIIICTIVSGSNVVCHLKCVIEFGSAVYCFSLHQKSTANPDLIVEEAPSSFSVLFWWALGIILLTVALFMSARMGIYQEVLYKKHGKYPDEALFITVRQRMLQLTNLTHQ